MLPRQANDQWYMQRRIVNEESVRLFTVFSQALPVVSTQDDEGFLQQVLIFQETDDTADLFVGKSNLSVIRMRLVFFSIGRGWLIGIVRVIQVHPEKERPRRILPKPFKSLIGNNIAGPLHFIQVCFLQSIEFKMVVIEIEAAIQSEARIQNS